MPPRLTVIRGEPGETWTNTTGKVWYQRQCIFRRSCAVCIQKHGDVAAWHNLPEHRGCSCIQVPLPPGSKSVPFVDYQAEVASLDPAQQSAVMGRNAWRLVEQGVVRWEDVVTRSRIRPLHEVVDRAGLSVEKLRGAGIPDRIARDAWDAVHRPEILIARKAQANRIQELIRLGIPEDQVLAAVGGRLTSRVRLAQGPRGGGLLVVPDVGPKLIPPAPKGPTGPFPESIAAVKIVRSLGGSTGAQLVEDEFGRRFVRKAGASADHLREEATADAVYRAIGIDVPDSQIFETSSGPVKLAKFVDGQTLADLRRSNPKAAARAEEKLRKGFAADALLGNWDVVGLSADNVLVTPDGKVYRIDNGGSLRFRAQGARKSSAQFGGAVQEIASMRSEAINSASASVFGKLSDADVRKQARALVRRRKAILDSVRDPELRQILSDRLDALKVIGKEPPKTAAWVPRPASEFRTLGYGEHDTFGNAAYRKWATGLTTGQKEAISTYTGEGYQGWNRWLRKIGEKPGSQYDTFTRDLDAALAKGSLSEGIVAVRGFSLKAAGLDRDRLTPGMQIRDPAYVSTSLNHSFSFGGDRFQVRIPKGFPGAYVNAAGSHSQNPSEKEFLLPRNVHFRIVEVRPDVIVVEAELDALESPP